MDLTVLAIPMYFGGMAGEALLLRSGRGAPQAVGYESRDTVTSLAMGTASLLAPLIVRPAVAQLRPKAGRYGTAALGVLGAGAIATEVATRVARRARTTRARRRAEQVASVTGPVTVATATAIASAVVTGNLTTKKMYQHRLLPDLGTGPLAVLTAVVGWDFVYYWNHRFMHEFRHMWAIHVVHHSSQHYNLSTALRQAWADSFGTFVPYAVGLVGVRPELVMQARGINLIYQFWIHTEAVDRLGPLEKVLNTASHHRVHHGANKDYIDKNYGSILICWDKLFGTFEPEMPSNPVTYGLTKNLHSFNPIRVMTHEYVDIARDIARSTRWSDRFKFAFASPGWALRRRSQLDAQLA